MIPDLLLFQPKLFADARGFFYESFNHAQFEQTLGTAIAFVQDNHSRSQKHVLRGLHYQIRQPQGKLVRVSVGEILDVAVDLRRASPSFGRWESVILSAENRKQMWIPAGFAHGFVALSDTAEVLYKTTDYWAPEHERSIRWDDPDLAIDWHGITAPILSAKDEAASSFAAAEYFA